MELMKRQGNEVSIVFRTLYRHDGTGLISFTDGTDNNQYLYTQFEAFYAHKAFPCFNQPDLRAPLSFKALAPAEWTVVGNGAAAFSENIKQPGFDEVVNDWDYGHHFAKTYGGADITAWEFNDTPSITPYLYAFIVGPYVKYSRAEHIPGRDDKLALSTMCRASLKEDMLKLADIMIDATVDGIKFYSQFFGIDFPYEKYDQIFCPEFKFGAMENVGAVTYTENLLFRG